VLRQAVRADLPTVVDIWVEAFSTDPYFRWIAPDDRDWPSFGARWMRLISDLCFERGHTYLAADVAVAWVPPDVAVAGPDDFARGRSLIAEQAGDEVADQALAAILAARAHAIDRPHWTLQYIGVRDRARGQGLGATAVAPVLASADRDGLPVGLTSTNGRNVAFYERHGFRVVAEVPTARGEAVLRPMVRIQPTVSRLQTGHGRLDA
jgi:ribosomal protein S18 acetylase RimI-like enzyme